MARLNASTRGAQQMRGTILQLRRKLADAQAELELARRVVRAARKYLNSGSDQELRQAMIDVGWEEPPRKPKPRPHADEPELPNEGPPFRATDGFELL